MDLLLLLKAGWTMIEVELSLPQCLCTFGKEKGFSLINPPTTFTIKGREWNRIFLLRTLIHPSWDIYHNTVGICFLQLDRTQLF